MTGHLKRPCEVINKQIKDNKGLEKQDGYKLMIAIEEVLCLNKDNKQTHDNVLYKEDSHVKRICTASQIIKNITREYNKQNKQVMYLWLTPSTNNGYKEAALHLSDFLYNNSIVLAEKEDAMRDTRVYRSPIVFSTWDNVNSNKSGYLTNFINHKKSLGYDVVCFIDNAEKESRTNNAQEFLTSLEANIIIYMTNQSARFREKNMHKVIK